MLSIALHTNIESDRIFLPELKRFIGKKVKITIEEENPTKKEFLDDFFDLAGEVEIENEALSKLLELSH